MLLYKSISRRQPVTNQSSPILQRDIAQMSCAQWCRLTQTDCNLLAICLLSKISMYLQMSLSESDWSQLESNHSCLETGGLSPGNWKCLLEVEGLACLTSTLDDKLQGGCCLIITLFLTFIFSHLATIYYKISLRYFLENVRIMWTIFSDNCEDMTWHVKKCPSFLMVKNPQLNPQTHS